MGQRGIIESADHPINFGGWIGRRRCVPIFVMLSHFLGVLYGNGPRRNQALKNRFGDFPSGGVVLPQLFAESSLGGITIHQIAAGCQFEVQQQPKLESWSDSRSNSK